MKNEKTLAILFAFVTVEVMAILCACAFVLASWNDVKNQERVINRKSDTIWQQKMQIMELLHGDTVYFDR